MTIRVTAVEARHAMAIARRGATIQPQLEDIYEHIMLAAGEQGSSISYHPEIRNMSSLEAKFIAETLREDGYIVTQEAGVMTISWDRAL